MRKTIITIHPTNSGFNYGECATKAISQAFNISETAFFVIADLMKLKARKGLNFWECTKVINRIAKVLHFRVDYVSNTSRVEYGQMLTILNKGKYITMFDIHVSYACNGEVYDDYFYDDDEPTRLKSLQQIPTGWWQIK